jgi:hypothetical protein
MFHMEQKSKEKPVITTAVPLLTSRSTWVERLSAEWHGDGRLKGQGAWGEIFLSLLFALPTGIALLFWPDANSHTRTFNLVMWSYPIWVIGIPLVVSGVSTVTGIALFFMRGRCVASRWLRLFGGGIGVTVYMGLFIVTVHLHGPQDAIVYGYLLPFGMSLRVVSQALRRF